MSAPWQKRKKARQGTQAGLEAAIAAAAPAANRGPCVRCGEPVGWHDGLLNWFGKTVHHRCAGRQNEQPGERRRIGTCPRCKFAVFADNATQTGGGAWVHPACARGE